MEEREWVQRSDRQMHFTILRSSRGRSWSGCEAYLYEASDGYSEELMPNHSISMHVSSPALVTTRCDGKALHRLQVPGDLKFVPAGYSRIYETATGTRKFSIELMPALVESIAAEMGVGQTGTLLTPQLHLADERVAHIVRALAVEVDSEEPAGRLYAESLATALIVQLLRHRAPIVERRVYDGLPRRRLQRVLEYIHEHISHELGLTELAAVANLSVSHFKVLFKQSTGMPVHQYVLRVRVEHAFNLIRQTALPFSEVALRSGFADQSHLARWMRRLRGITPTELRRES